MNEPTKNREPFFSTLLAGVLGVPVTASTYGQGQVILTVTALDNNVAITDFAATDVVVFRPAPLTGEVSLLTTVGTASAKAGQPLKIGSLFKAVDMENQFNLVKTTIDVTLTGGLVFADNIGQNTYRPQFTRLAVSTSVYPHSKTMNDALLLVMKPNSSGTVTLKVTAKTATFDITDEATATVNVPTPGPVPAPPAPAPVAPTPVTVAPTPATVAPPTPEGGAPAVGGGNRAPVAQSVQLIATTGVVSPLVLSATDPDGNALTFVVVQFPAHGKLSGQAPNLQYTPDGGFVGTDALVFTATDGTASSVQATATITVTGKASIAKTVRKVVRKTVKKTTKKR